jgi:hypothetical protein
MAKKKNAPRKKPRASAPLRSPRKEPYSGARISSVVERLREQAARLAGLARSMEDAEIDRIVIDGHAMLLRGLNQIDNFTDNASRAVREAKTAKADH